jgi:hypothetical protein
LSPVVTGLAISFVSNPPAAVSGGVEVEGVVGEFEALLKLTLSLIAAKDGTSLYPLM